MLWFADVCGSGVVDLDICGCEVVDVEVDVVDVSGYGWLM